MITNHESLIVMNKYRPRTPNAFICIDGRYVALTVGKIYVLSQYDEVHGRYASDASAFVKNDDGITYKYLRRRFEECKNYKPLSKDNDPLHDFK